MQEEDGTLSWQEQRQEAIRRQHERWRQEHPDPQQSAQQRQQQQSQQQHVSGYPVIPPAHAAGPLLHYPEVPAPSAPPFDQAAHCQPHAPPVTADTAAAEAERRRQQQEEEDHRLAMQLAEQFEAEELAAQAAAQQQAADPFDNPMEVSEDEEWAEVARTSSMERMAGPTGTAGRPRPSSQAAAAAGTTAGGLVGAGLSALLAMAAQAAANRAHQAATYAEADAQRTQASGGQSTQSTTAAAGGGRQTAAAGGQHTAAPAGTEGGSSSPGVLGMAANALRSFLASRAANQAGSSGAAAGSSGQHGTAEADRRWEDEQPGAQDLQMLQQLFGTLMGGNLPPGVGEGAAQASARTQAGSNATGGAGSSSSGFRVTRLPGGGFSATYSSSSGAPGSGVHVHTSTSTSSSGPGLGPFPGMGVDDDPMFANPDDFLSQLLLAGARSARQGGGRGTGFQHYDPTSGQTSWEAMGGAPGGPGGMGLEDLLNELMGPGLFGGGGGGMRYEDLVGLDPVHVTTPEDVLSSLPQSKFVEGRKPGDSDTCVICQTVYSAGDDMTHLPCLHAFHTDCITPWLQGHSRKCPVCKNDVC